MDIQVVKESVGGEESFFYRLHTHTHTHTQLFLDYMIPLTQRMNRSDRVMLAGTKSDLPSVRLHIYSSADQTIIRISDRVSSYFYFANAVRLITQTFIM